MSSPANESKPASELKGKKAPRRTNRSLKDSQTNQNVHIDNSAASKRLRTELKLQQSAKTVFYQEEEIAADRDVLEDESIFKGATAEIRTMMNDMKSLKASGKSMHTTEAESKKVHGTLQFVTLKKMNRIAHMRCKAIRDKTNEAKQVVDQHHLRLQNLLYEVMHLQKEITKCLEFTSKDEEISLVPLHDFYTEAPHEISKPEVTKADNHQQTLSRLDWELEQRKQLSEKLKQQEQSKSGVVKEIQSKKEYLDSLQPKLNAILEATKPVQEYLEMPFEEMRDQHRSASYLPRPLYVLYMQTSAYRDACDKNLEITVQGDLDVAKALASTNMDLDDESESDEEEPEKESKKRRRRATSHVSDRTSQKKQKLFKKHPLYVTLRVKCKGDATLQLTFSYLLHLEIITVNVQLTHSESSSSSTVSGGDLISPDILLSCLYPGDCGTNTPNPANHYVFNRMGISSVSECFNKIGKLYHWAQWMGGLQFLVLGDEDQVTVQQNVAASHMEETISRLRQRVAARMSLQKQLSTLERNVFDINSIYQKLFPAKISSQLHSWKRNTYEDFCSLDYCVDIVNAGLACTTDLFFVATMERASAKLTAQVVVSPDYPTSPPLFAISVQWKKQRTGRNDENIRDMEAELNIHYGELTTEKLQDLLLTNQLQRLSMCFDVYLETESEHHLEGPAEFAKDKIFPRITRGPHRAKPYMYNAGMGFFSQR